MGCKPIAMRTLERAFNALALSIGGAATGSAASAEQVQFAARLASCEPPGAIGVS